MGVDSRPLHHGTKEHMPGEPNDWAEDSALLDWGTACSVEGEWLMRVGNVLRVRY